MNTEPKSQESNVSVAAPITSGNPWVNPGPEATKDLCRKYGFLLDEPLKDSDDGTGRRIIGAQLLWALACRESSKGTNCKPRLEPAYDFGGRYASESHQRVALEEYGSDAAKSYGPWQVMFCNAPGFTPHELMTQPEKSVTATIGFLKRYVLGARKARTLAQIADTFNSGNWRDAQSAAVKQYIEAVTNFYHSEVL